MFNKLYVFGDSILKGVTYDGVSGKYTLCPASAVRLLSDAGVSVDNRSHMGATVCRGEALAERMSVLPGPDDVVLLEYGGNDCDQDWQAVSDRPEEPHPPRLPEEDFVARYRGLIRRFRDAGARVCLATLVPLDAQRYFETVTRGRDAGHILSWLGDVQMLYRRQERYNSLILKLAEQEGCPVVDLRTPFLVRRDLSHLLCADGIHPTAAGQALLGDVLKDAFLP